MLSRTQNDKQILKVLCVVGARPNFMKITPIMSALAKSNPPFDVCLVHTGQHYDTAMNQQYFDALGIPQPNVNLEVGSGSHAIQTAEIMKRFEPVLDDEHPDAVLVVGDVNSTLACALVAAKKGIGIVHVEAGLRSFDRTMPEEINRVLTDQISDLLFTTERGARENLLREGIDDSKIYFVGNVMIDTLHHNLPKAIPAEKTIAEFKINNFPANKGQYAVLTLHRSSNVDDPKVLSKLLECIAEIGTQIRVLFPVHPRTKAKVEQYGLAQYINGKSIVPLPPLGYLEMLGLMKDARVVLTDSGGIQEETTALGVPCITLRTNTERPITIEEGTNTLAGIDPKKILDAFNDILRTGGKAGRVPDLWDGRSAERIASLMHTWLQQRTMLKEV